ncbi:MAG: HYExAFE family protein [Phycisphaerales bacterium]
MAQRRHHYEQAFEGYLRARRVPYVAVDEAKNALLPEGARFGHAADDVERSLKSFDFVVYGAEGNLLLDVKGRKIARAAKGRGAGWSRPQNWVTQDDVDSMRTWRALFGEGSEAAFVFAYWCAEQPPDGLFQEVFAHRGRWYAVLTVTLPDYEANMRVRSARWRTVHLPSAVFERVSRPFCPAGTDEAPTPNHALHPLHLAVP